MPRWLLVASGYALLAAAWVFATPAGAGPNESANLVRSAAIGFGQWEGRAVEAGGAPSSGLTPAQAAFRAQQTREFTLPAGLVPPPVCFLGREDVTGVCLQRPERANQALTVTADTDVGAYPPFVYLPAGLAVRLAGDWITAVYLGRLALALVSVLLVAAAAWAFGRGPALWSLTGMVLALTPAMVAEMALFSPAGVEATAAVAFGGALLALSRGNGEDGAGPLGVLGVSGAVLATARPLGVGILAALALAALPVTGLRWLLRGAGFVALVLVVAGVAAALVWARAHQGLQPLDPAGTTAGLGYVADRAAVVLRQQVVGTGWLDVTLPSAVTFGWLGLLGLITVGAFVVARWRERIAMLLAVAAAATLAAGLYQAVLHPAGLDLQGRYVLPVLVLVPMVAGLALQRARPGAGADTFLVGLAAMGLQFTAFWFNARRYAVGVQGPLSFLSSPQWTPPGGWLLWLVLAGLGAMLVALSLMPSQNELEPLSLPAVSRRVSVSR